MIKYHHKSHKLLSKFYNILIISLVAIVLSSSVILSYADYTSPRKQVELGVLPEDIQCRENRVLVIRDNGNPVCVQESTADKMNWSIIATEFVQKVITPNNAVQIDDKVENIKDVNDLTEHESTNVNSVVDDDHTNNNDEQEFIVLDLGSDVEYVDDGREIHFGLQRSPAPDNIYERIIDNQEDNNIDPHGNMRISASFVHEKYSIVGGIGLYPADWMPTHVPDGYKLLYFDNYYYTEGTGDAVLRLEFVPNTFELTNQTTTHDVKFSGGFTVNVMRDVLPRDQTEDTMEYYRELIESYSGYQGRWIDMQRDGKTMWVSETQSNSNHYQATVGFNPDEYTLVGVTSHYLTIEELLPIFNSVMN